ncbi:MAG: DUF2062 domain-containing protein [Pseudomonadota bacterium]
MPRQTLKKILPSRDKVKRQFWLRPFQRLLDHPDLWAVRRRSVAPGVALGLFWTWIPIPAHSIAAGLSALALRVHLPLAMFMTLLVNPLTIIPIYFSGYLLGKRLLNSPPLPSGSFDMAVLSEQFGAVWQPLLLGNAVLGLVSALFGYVVIEGLWRTRVGQYLNARQRRKQGAA